MVNPLWILIIALGIAFLISLFDKIGKSFTMLIFFSALVVITAISAQWFFHLLYGGESINIFTAGFKPPFSINLKVGLIEAVFLLLVNLAALMSAFYLSDKFKKTKSYALSLFLSLVLGLNGLIMTRDLFNIFVFLEITSIATYALISLDRNIRSLSAGFKYVIAGGIASALFLLGTIYIYKFTGSLNIDYIIASKHLLVGKTGFLAVFLLLSAILIELKPFPANGWALDVYQAANPSIAALISAASSAAIFFVFYKILPFIQADLVTFLSVLGIITFIFSNLIGLKQTSSRRLLGYSSIGQIGLLIAAITLIKRFPSELEYAISMEIVVGGLLINHFFA
jgi:formate hydrogenlyase subunit 3/multisubunit Na+/H+ antiporter MnhD subunit